MFHAYVLRPTGVANQYTVVFDSGLLTVPALDRCRLRSGEASRWRRGVAVQAGDMLAFYGQGIPVDTGAGNRHPQLPGRPRRHCRTPHITLGGAGLPGLAQPRTYSFGAIVDVTATTPTISGGIRKFVDGLPGLNAANNLGQLISVASADTATYAGADYYEIAVVQYREKMHSDLPPTLLRGYVQLKACTAPGAIPLSNAMLTGPDVPTGYCGVTAPHYLGATIAATKDKPVRILFRNLLPTGQGGDLFIPTDITVMGSGMGPSMWGMPETTPQTPTCGLDPKPAGCYTENRAVLHLHGGRTPWISDGTPHQWITPFGERDHLTDTGAATENKGDSVEYVPDMWYDASGNTIASARARRPATSRARRTIRARAHRPTTTPTSRAPGCCSTTTTPGASPA